ncbi:hypothetical protein FQN53_004460 [Emmonsiellopsis sp. PD_33]|nr:hypothetical protein FQN53_004460 [Emmonsiellopsis sp. PD_33]
MKLADLPPEILDEILNSLGPYYDDDDWVVDISFFNARIVCKYFDNITVDLLLRTIRLNSEKYFEFDFTCTPATPSKRQFVARLLHQSVKQAASHPSSANCPLARGILLAAKESVALVMPDTNGQEEHALRYRDGLIHVTAALAGFRRGGLSKEALMQTIREVAIIAAANIGSVSDLQCLIGLPGAFPTYEHNSFGIAFYGATFGGHEGAVRYLLGLKNVQLDFQNLSGGDTALHCAVLAGHNSIVRLLLDRGAGIDIQNFSRETPLLCATLSGHGSIISLLVANGADPNLRDQYGWTALMRATENSDEPAVRRLLKSDTIEVGSTLGLINYWNASERVMNENFASVLEMLLLSPKSNCNSLGYTTLQWACVGGYDFIVRLLLDDERFWNNLHDYIYTEALPVVILHDNVEAMKLILQSKYVDFERLAILGQLLLHLAVWHESHKSLKVLLGDPRFNPNIEDEAGETPLTTAFATGNIQAARLLLSNNVVDCNLAGNAGATPLSRANSEDILQALLDHPRIENRNRGIHLSGPFSDGLSA